MWDEDGKTPAKKPNYELGADLSRYSVDELSEYISVLEAERGRVEAALQAKKASMHAADSVFKL